MTSSTSTWRIAVMEGVLVAITLSLVVGLGIRTWSSADVGVDSPGPAVPQELIALRGEIAGSLATAKVAVVVFSDFYCPFCRTFAQRTQPKLIERYVAQGNVLWVFRHLPLDSLHPMASAAAAVATCAGVQNKFWMAHDSFFDVVGKSTKTLDPEEVVQLLDVDGSKLESCLPSARVSVRADVEEARRLSLKATPSFLIGEVRGGMLSVNDVLIGAQSEATFTEVIERNLSRTKLPVSALPK